DLSFNNLFGHVPRFPSKTFNIVGNPLMCPAGSEEQGFGMTQEYIDSGFARFNTVITSLKALDEGFSSKNYVRKLLRDLHPKWRTKVTMIEESKDLSSLALDELIDSEIYRGKRKRIKSIALKAKKESSDDETLTSGSDDKEYAMAIRNYKKFFRRKGYSHNSKAYVVLNKHTKKVKESLNVTFDESSPPTKLLPLVDNDVGEEEAIKRSTKVVNNNKEKDESIE
nr:UBN2 domain-containing protein [Tanacetum cinerariifolium]